MHNQGKIVNIFWRCHHTLFLDITDLKAELNNLIIQIWSQNFSVWDKITLTIINSIKIKIK